MGTFKKYTHIGGADVCIAHGRHGLWAPRGVQKGAVAIDAKMTKCSNKYTILEVDNISR